MVHLDDLDVPVGAEPRAAPHARSTAARAGRRPSRYCRSGAPGFRGGIVDHRGDATPDDFSPVVPMTIACGRLRRFAHAAASYLCASSAAGCEKSTSTYIDAMILVIDNYDSFTWNLVHYLQELGPRSRSRATTRSARPGDIIGRRGVPDLARPLHAQRSRDQPRSGRGLRRPETASARRVPRPSGDRPAFRRAVVRGGLMHGKTSRSSMTAAACSPACPRPSPRRAIIRWWSPTFPTPWSSTRRPTTGW
jgi:hypothetical protein